MVCFHIVLAYPVHQNNSANDVFFKQFNHMCKHLNAEYTFWYETKESIYIRVAICDNDAIALLRDIPSPVYCVSVKYSKNEDYIYKNYKVLQEEIRPPRDSFLKRVYWTASQLQRRGLYKIQKVGI